MNKFALAIVVVILTTPGLYAQQPPNALYPFSMSFDETRTVLRVFDAPLGFERYPENKMNEFQAWVTNLPLMKENMPVTQWNGQIKYPADSAAAVIDFGVGTEPQQNPDIPIQLIIEYLRAVNALDDFPVIISPKDTLTYSRWLGGTYVFTARKELVYKPGDTRNSTTDEYYRYLSFVMSQINSRNLLLNMKPVADKDVAPANVFVQFRKDDPDSVGHCAVILDVCTNKEGKTLVMAGWGGFPAHAFFIARPESGVRNPWFTIPVLRDYLKAHGDGKFYRFSN